MRTGLSWFDCGDLDLCLLGRYPGLRGHLTDEGFPLLG